MNVAQLNYIQTVLGVSLLIQPPSIRSAYKLHRSSEKQTQFLFFCTHLDTKQKKSLIQNIAKAIDYSESMIVEILDTKHPHIPLLLNNFFTRFLPQGFVIFGYDLAVCLNPNSEKYTQNKTINWNPNISGCILNSISDFIMSESDLSSPLVKETKPVPEIKKIQETKTQAWNILKSTFKKTTIYNN